MTQTKTSCTQNAIPTIAKGLYSISFRSTGFQRKGNHFYRTSEDVIHGIHFQCSQWGSNEEGSFTINLMVTSPFVYQAWTGKPLPANPATALFPIQIRIGLLLPSRKDKWWNISQSTEISSLVAEINQALLLYGLPFFDQYPNQLALLSKLDQGKSLPGLSGSLSDIVLAMLEMQFGLRVQAKKRIEAAIKKAASSPFAATIITVGQRMGAL